MGKTSLLRRLEGLTDAIPLYLNLQGTYGDPLRMGEDLADQVRLQARHNSRLGGLAATGRPLWEVIDLLAQETAPLRAAHPSIGRRSRKAAGFTP